MKRFFSFGCLSVIVMLITIGCSSSGNSNSAISDDNAGSSADNSDANAATQDTTKTPASYGTECKTNEDCESLLCINGFCSKECAKQSECPKTKSHSFDCGLVSAINKTACYVRNYLTVQYAVGYDCSLDGLCGVDYKCTGQSGDADRYCTAKCETDMDCPPQMRCAALVIGKEAPQKMCMRRQFCHPCELDDQCGPQSKCLLDKNGNKYCGKQCDPKSSTTCPPYATCVDMGGGDFQCQHKAGYCYKNFNGESGMCEPCLVHGWESRLVKTTDAEGKTSIEGWSLAIAEDGICQPGAFCFLLSQYTGEAVCATPCQASETDATKLTCGASNYGCYRAKNAVYKDSNQPVYDENFCVPITKDEEYDVTVIGTCQP